MTNDAGKSQAPAQTVALVATRLGEYLARYERERSPQAMFAYAYMRLTRRLELALTVGEPAFADPAWVADLARSLAAEYFTAMDRIDDWITSGGIDRTAEVKPVDLPADVPEPWREVYAASSGARSYVLEDALFAMMAHISYDLPMALLGMSKRVAVNTHLADFHRMNDVLGAAIDGVQDDLAGRYNRALADLDQLLIGQDELFSNYGIRLSRGMAWYNFERLTDSHAAPDALRSIRTSTGALIKQVRAPDDWRLRVGLGLARLLVPERRRWPAD